MKPDLSALITEHGVAAVSDAFDRALGAHGLPTLHQLHARVHAVVTRDQLTLADEHLSNLAAHERIERMMHDLDTIALERGRLEEQHDRFRREALKGRAA